MDVINCIYLDKLPDFKATFPKFKTTNFELTLKISIGLV
jgi:hypothetical protein